MGTIYKNGVKYAGGGGGASNAADVACETKSLKLHFIGAVGDDAIGTEIDNQRISVGFAGPWYKIGNPEGMFDKGVSIDLGKVVSVEYDENVKSYTSCTTDKGESVFYFEDEELTLDVEDNVANALDRLSKSQGGGGDVQTFFETTYEELKALRDNGNLVAGAWYRITDYETVYNIRKGYYTDEDGNRISYSKNENAGHRFDVLVCASSPSSLDSSARAMQHEGEDYFADCNLGAWRLLYNIDNESAYTYYLDLDVENSKGIIYGMIDENGNDVNYDFKNIKKWNKAAKACLYTFGGADEDDSLSGASQLNIVRSSMNETCTLGYYALYNKVINSKIDSFDSTGGDNNLEYVQAFDSEITIQDSYLSACTFSHSSVTIRNYAQVVGTFERCYSFELIDKDGVKGLVKGTVFSNLSNVSAFISVPKLFRNPIAQMFGIVNVKEIILDSSAFVPFMRDDLKEYSLSVSAGLVKGTPMNIKTLVAWLGMANWMMIWIDYVFDGVAEGVWRTSNPGTSSIAEVSTETE